MKKSGWLALPAAFFLLVNFSVSPVKILFAKQSVFWFFLISLFLILRKFSLERILPPIIGGVSFIIFFYGIIQKYVLFPYYLTKVTPEDNFYSQALITRIQSGRIFSLFTLPTLYAIICSVLLIFIFHYLLTPGKKRTKIFWIFLLLAGVFNLVLTQSFGGVLCFSAGILVYSLMAGILKFRYLAPVLMVLSLFFFITIALRFSEARELEPIKLRLTNWSQAFRMIGSSPFWGVGLGNYEARVSSFTLSPDAKSIYAHNFFLQFTAETGFFIPLFLLLLLAISWKKLKPGRYKEKKPYITILLVILLYNIIDIGLYFFTVGIAVTVALSQVYPQKQETRMAKWSLKPAMNTIAFVLLGLLLLVESLSENYRKTADFLEAQKDYENAQHYYEKSFQINPYNYNALVKYAEIRFRFNFPGEAEKYLDRALKLYPDFAAAHYLKSQLELKKEHLLHSFYHAAAAYNKYKPNDRYRQWFDFIKLNLETLINKEVKAE